MLALEKGASSRRREEVEEEDDTNKGVIQQAMHMKVDQSERKRAIAFCTLEHAALHTCTLARSQMSGRFATIRRS